MRKRKRWLTTAEAAEYLRCSVVTLYRLRKAGKLRGHRLGKDVRYRGEDLDALPEPEGP